MLDGGVSLQLLTLEASDLRIRLLDGSVVRQVEVDHKFGAIRRREELLLHETHPEQGERKGCDRHRNGDPAVTHANRKDVGK